eukprot:2442991-Amphidinium_carterae.1
MLVLPIGEGREMLAKDIIRKCIEEMQVRFVIHMGKFKCKVLDRARAHSTNTAAPKTERERDTRRYSSRQFL